MCFKKCILFCIIIFSILFIPLYAGGKEISCPECTLCYPLVYSVTLFIPGLIFLNIFIEPDETWHRFSFQNFLDAYTRPPEDDKDSWIFNYILHPLWGSETYLRLRMNGCSWWQSWLFSNAMSVLWEYGFESWNTHPSIQDLLITGNIGSVLGEIRFRVLVSVKDMRPSFLRNSLWFLLDPFQSIIDNVKKICL